MSESTSEQYNWFITGTSRGIGFELVKQLLQSPHNTVVAACRNPEKANDLQSLTATADDRLHIVRLDVTDTETIKNAAQETSTIVGEQGIDYLINNAGIAVIDSAFAMDITNLLTVFQTNVAGPAYISQTFSPLVAKSKKKTIVHISSTLASIGSDIGAFGASYPISKTALNMLAYKQAKTRPDFTVIAICPGHLQTDMGGKGASTALPVSVGVAGVLKVVLSRTLEDSGSFFNFKGERVPW